MIRLMEGQAPRFTVSFWVVGPRPLVQKKASWRRIAVIPINEFLVLDKGHNLSTDGRVSRSWPAFGGHLFTNSVEGEKRVVESRDTVFSPAQPEPVLGGD
jgi:hypothetical protein